MNKKLIFSRWSNKFTSKKRDPLLYIKASLDLPITIGIASITLKFVN